MFSNISRNSEIPPVFLFLLIFCFLSGGCVYWQHREQIQTLRQMEQSQKEMEAYLKKQKRLFFKLKADVENNKVKKGLLKKWVLSRYGEPIFCRESGEIGQDGIRESCFYRHPQEYFGTDMIYLYFDASGHLLRWQLTR